MRLTPASRGVECAALVLLLAQWLALGAWAVSWLAADGRGGEGMPPLGHDLRVFWTVSWITEQFGALAAFDPTVLIPTQLRFFPAYPEAGRWLYPPPFQWLIAPISRLPYPLVYALYVALSIALLVAAVRYWRRLAGWPWLVVGAFPGLWVTLLAGQNSVLTLWLTTMAITYASRRATLAGVCGGLLIIKPQFAVLLPLWWLCGRHWRALTWAAITAAIVFGLTLLWSGWALWQAFLTAVSQFNAQGVQQGAGGIWHAMPTVFAVARLHGAGLPLAYGWHAAIAAPSVIGAAWLWRRRAPLRWRVASAMIATLLAQPYLLYYELVWLIVPLLCLSCEAVGASDAHDARPEVGGRREPGGGAWQRVDRWLVAAAWLLPMQAYLAVLWPPMGQWGAVVLPMLMARTLWRAWQAPDAHNDAHRL